MGLKKILILIFNFIGIEVRKVITNNSLKYKELKKQEFEIIRKISNDFKILNGPFKGIIYKTPNITEATFLPKIVGSYECQLHELIYSLSKVDYKNIIIIGCAEGYYALGLAKIFPNSIVHAYDINKSDLIILENLAKINGLRNIITKNLFNIEEFSNFNFNDKTLIFSDCEGYEIELFNSISLDQLLKVDIIVEIHDFAKPNISKEIYNCFFNSHRIEILNNRLLTKKFNWEHLEDLSNHEREIAVMEHRGGIFKNIYMEWFFLKSI